jgi:hypothetical protein
MAHRCLGLWGLALLLGPWGLARAEEWQVLGARYHGLGGAGVALAFEADAADWNPGTLAFSPRTEEVSLRGGLSAASEGEFLDHAARAVDFVDRTRLDDSIRNLRGGGELSEEELRNALRLAVVHAPPLTSNDQGGHTSVDSGMALRRGRFVLTGRAYGFAGVDPSLDLRSFSLGAAGIFAEQLVGGGADRSDEFRNPGSASLASALVVANPQLTTEQAQELVFQAEQARINTGSRSARRALLQIASGLNGGAPALSSGVSVRGLYVKQLGFAYGVPLIEDVLGLGVQLKYMHGTTHAEFIGVDASGDTERSGRSPRRRSRELGLDVGLLYQPQPWLRLGISARNVNSPQFKVVSGQERIRLDPQVRFGVAIELTPRLRFATDLDLTRNSFETMGGVNSQIVASGLEYRTSFKRLSLDLRGGMYRNLVSGLDDHLTLTFGLGLHMPRSASRFDLSFSYGLGGERAPRLDMKVPRRADFAGAFRWIREF